MDMIAMLAGLNGGGASCGCGGSAYPTPAQLYAASPDLSTVAVKIPLGLRGVSLADAPGTAPIGFDLPEPDAPKAASLSPVGAIGVGLVAYALWKAFT